VSRADDGQAPMLPDRERRFLDESRVAHLATADACAVPHVVPVCFVVAGSTLYITIDAKPKRGGTLKRVQNILANPAVAVVVDRYDEDWTRLGWVMLRGQAEILDAGTEHDEAQALLRARYPQLTIAPLRGNVQTRLRKLDEGQYAGIILAAAGLQRLGLAARITSMLEPEDSLPAAGQGALGIECREARTDLLEMLQPLNHAESAWCVRAERSVSRALSGSCVMPIGAFARRVAAGMSLRAFVASPDGRRHVSGEERAPDLSVNPEAMGKALANKLLAGGAREILAALAREQ
jgi:PPOX class probable F420-dependent enzyme